MALVDERGRRFSWGGGVDPNWVAKIEITTAPTNTQYAGNDLYLTGLVITATKRDGTTEQGYLQQREVGRCSSDHCHIRLS